MRLLGRFGAPAAQMRAREVSDAMVPPGEKLQRAALVGFRSGALLNFGLVLGECLSDRLLRGPVVLAEEIPLRHVDKLTPIAGYLDADGSVLDLRGLDLRIWENILDEPSRGIALLEAAVSVCTAMVTHRLRQCRCSGRTRQRDECRRCGLAGMNGWLGACRTRR